MDIYLYSENVLCVQSEPPVASLLATTNLCALKTFRYYIGYIYFRYFSSAPFKYATDGVARSSKPVRPRASASQK